jgi:predicted DNA-binding protein
MKYIILELIEKKKEDSKNESGYTKEMIEYFIEELEDAISCFDSRKL